MKKLLKRTISMLLVVMMVFSIVPTSFAQAVMRDDETPEPTVTVAAPNPEPAAETDKSAPVADTPAEDNPPAGSDASQTVTNDGEGASEVTASADEQNDDDKKEEAQSVEGQSEGSQEAGERRRRSVRGQRPGRRRSGRRSADR